ncbi:hypothetical protein P7C70_g8633, partial [Phenoliferia sp. Uapishka_3]
MRFTLPSLVLALAPLASALVVVLPAVGTVWDQIGSEPNIISWSLLPLTNPAPATSFFDIWIRNGEADLYPGILNISIATRVDSSAGTSLAFQLSGQLLAGTGSLLSSAPPSSSIASSSLSSTFATTLSKVVVQTGQGMVISTTATRTVTTTSTATETGILHAATNPGGPAEQGLSLGFSAGGRKEVGTWRFGGLAAIGLGGALWLL